MAEVVEDGSVTAAVAAMVAGRDGGRRISGEEAEATTTSDGGGTTDGTVVFTPEGTVGTTGIMNRGGVADGECDDARNTGVGRSSTSRSSDGVAGAKSSSCLSKLPARITDGSANASGRSTVMSVAKECTDSADEDDGGRPSATDGGDLARWPLDRERRGTAEVGSAG